MIDHDAAAELWERYKRGERNVFTRRLYTMQGQQTFEEIRKRYRADREFSQTVDRYIGEFERLLEEVSQGERGQATARSYLTSDTGKVYTMLAHAAGPLRVGRPERDRTRQGRRERRPCRFARFWHRGAWFRLSQSAPSAGRSPGAFTIARGAKTEAEVVVAELADGRRWGAANACPMRATTRPSRASWRQSRRCAGRSRTASSGRRCNARCRRAPRATRSTARSGISRRKRAASRSTRSPGWRRRDALTTAYTISLGTPEAMARGGAERPRRASS